VNLVTILGELRRQRGFVMLAALAALLAMLLVAFKLPSLDSRRQQVGIATARVLVDTPESVILGVAPKGADTLGVRANLIASLMVEGDVRATIAKQAGLAPKDLKGVAESAADVATGSRPQKQEGNVLTTRVAASTEGDLPLIEIEAQAGSAASAIKLADAAVAGLREYLDTKAAGEEIAAAKRLNVRGLGGAQAYESVRGPGVLTALVAGLLVFVLGCAAIILAAVFRRGWRASSVAAVEEPQPDPGNELVALDGLFELDHWTEPTPGREPAGDGDAQAKSA
jgi:hypothetical protein